MRLLDNCVKDTHGGRPRVVVTVDEGAPGDLPPVVATTVRRVIQEGLTNVTRHAPGAEDVRVDVARADHEVTVTITNDAAHGASGAPRSGFGLVGLTERVEALGGSLTAGPVPRRGWRLSARLPLPDAA